MSRGSERGIVEFDVKNEQALITEGCGQRQGWAGCPGQRTQLVERPGNWRGHDVVAESEKGPEGLACREGGLAGREGGR